MPALDFSQRDFELNIWGLTRQPSSLRQWFQSAWRHDPQGLHQNYWASWCDKVSGVNPVHLFACGQPRSGGLRQSRSVLQWLLRHGGSMDQCDAAGWLPINYAAWFGHAATMDVLLEAGSPVVNPKGPQPLDAALMSLSQSDHQGSETCARLLLMHGANPNAGFSSDAHYGGVTWLTWALEKQRWDWAETLWARGQQSISERELHMLILRGSKDTLLWMQAHGVDVLSRLSPTHEFFQDLRVAQAHHERQSMLDELSSQLRLVFDDADQKHNERILSASLPSSHQINPSQINEQNNQNNQVKDGEGDQDDSSGDNDNGRQKGGRGRRKL